MKILAIDPGETQSAAVMLGEDSKIVWHWKEANRRVNRLVYDAAERSEPITLAIEFPRARGMPASNELFRTILWAGRFLQTWLFRYQVGISPLLIDRAEVKLFHCGKSNAKDSNIRAAIIDRYGGKDIAIGRKKSPGPLYGVTADRWAALAVALLVADRRHDAAWIAEREVRQ